MISGVISLFLGIVGALGAYVIYKNNVIIRRNGRPVSGRVISYEEIPGRPTRYVVKVEFSFHNSIRQRKIVTTDKRIKNYENTEVTLLYVEEAGKIFWAEEHSKEWIICIVLSVSFSIFMFLLSVTCFAFYTCIFFSPG